MEQQFDIKTKLNYLPGNRKIFLFIFILTLTFAYVPSLISQTLPQYQLNEVVVTAGRTPISFSDLTRSVIVITPEEIKEAPVHSVQGLLQYAAGVDLAQRGVDGVQSDVSIRGGSFEETLVLIDGVSVDDPQTGHHNLNLPVTLDDIQRIEILKGPGSSIYGANAFSGVINIITKKGRDKNLSLKLSGGQNSYYDGSIYGAYPIGIFNNHISFSRQKSNGFMYNTEFNISNFTYETSIASGESNLNLFFGYNDKKYGANSFYSVLFPNQWEHTTTKLLNIGGVFGNKALSISPKIYWRRNDDNYLLDYMQPSFYQNIHQTNIYGTQIQVSFASVLGTTSIGGEYNLDKIKSTNLGNHSRNKKGFFAEQEFSPLKSFVIIANAFAYDYSSIGWKIWPGINLGYDIAKNVRVYSSVGKAFRIPTYTELYYTSPASVGNPNLKYEQTLNYEAGINIVKPIYNAKLSIFRKEGTNLIDWVRKNSSQPWTAKNIASLNTNGFEISFTTNPSFIIKNFPVYRFGVDYTYLNSNKTSGQFQSQYLLQYLRHQLIVNVENNWWLGIQQSWEVRYEDRINFGNFFLVDTQLFKDFEYYNLFIKATNLFNKSYQEVSGVPLPGRWITAGIKLKLGL